MFEPNPVRRERTGDAWTLVFTRDLKHPRAKVWEALTDPDHLDAWSPFRPDRNLAGTGPATLTMPDGDTKANIVRAEPPALLEYRWDEDLLRWDLAEIEGGTRLTLRHTMSDGGFLPRVAAGWHICFDVADRLLAGDPVPVVRGEDAKKHGWQELADAYATKLDVRYEWRGEFTNDAVNRLHAEGFGHRLLDDDWWGQVNRHSLGWVVAYDGDELVGFVNVPWDGGIHAFIIDTLTAQRVRRQGIGTGLVAVAAREAAKAGCEWLHVDFDDHLAGFYFDSCGFTPTQAGLIALA